MIVVAGGGMPLYPECHGMKSRRTYMGRRTALGAVLVGAVITRAASGQMAVDAPGQDKTSMNVRIEFSGASMTAALYDNPSARDFAAMLPLDLTIDDYANNEKIAYLPRTLTEEGSGPF